LPLSTLPTQSIMPCECRQLFFSFPAWRPNRTANHRRTVYHTLLLPSTTFFEAIGADRLAILGGDCNLIIAGVAADCNQIPFAVPIGQILFHQFFLRWCPSNMRAVYHGSSLGATTIFAPGLEPSHPITFSLDSLCRFWYNPSRAEGAGAGFLQSFRALRGFLIHPFAIGRRSKIE